MSDDDTLKNVRLVVNNPTETLPPLPMDPDPSAAADTAPATAGPAPGDESAPAGPPAETGGVGDVYELQPGELPPDCVVTPLGVNGNSYYYLDQLGQLRVLAADKHGQGNLISLWGARADQLRTAWPRYSKAGQDGVSEIIGIRANDAAMSLMIAGARQGVYDPMDRVRGRGTWLGANAELIIHAGNGVWLSDGNGWSPPGEYGWHVYPASSALPRHDGYKAAEGDDGPAGQLLDMLCTWNWKRGETDAHLLLGWIGAAMLCGALKHRPLVWITGDKGTGKSTLHELVRGLFGGGIVAADDVTSAGLWQKLGHDALPVAVDELEAEADNARANAVIKLARSAATGGVILRGGADHSGQQFTARSCFMFSSILVPALLPQDRSRMAILDLRPLGEIDPPDLSDERLGKMGAALRQRMIDQWPRFGATLHAYRLALARHGHGGRGADQFGTLLACASCLLWDNPDTEDVIEGWAAKLPASADDDVLADHQSCLEHLLSSTVDPRGTGETIGQAIFRAAGLTQADHEGIDAAEYASKKLEGVGVKLLQNPAGLPTGKWIAIANRHVGLGRVYAPTHWAARSGAAGVWKQSLERVDGAVRYDKALRFAGAVSKAVLIPIETVTDEPDA